MIKLKHGLFLALTLVPASACFSQPSQPFFHDDFETADSTCWASRPNGGGTENLSGCAPWVAIGDPPFGSPPSQIKLLPHSPAAKSGSRAVRVTYNADEDLSYAQVNFKRDHIFFSQWLYFDDNFDFSLGLKIARIMAWDSANDVSFSDRIIVLYTAANTSGKDDMFGLTMARNGGENYGYADRTIFARNTWYHLECELKLNTPGLRDGLARVWVDDSMVIQRTGMGGTDLRPSGADTNHLTLAKIGGWYSNSGSDPSAPSIYYIDDVAIDTAYITANRGSVSNRSAVPVGSASMRKIGKGARRKSQMLFGQDPIRGSGYDSRGRLHKPD